MIPFDHVHHAYVTLASGADRFAHLRAALDRLGWELTDHRTSTEPVHALPDHAVAWNHLPGEPGTPGLLILGGGTWDPRLLWALSEVSGQLAVARLDDRTRDDHHFAVAYAGVRLLERGGDEDDNHAEFHRLAEAAAGLDPLLFRADAAVAAEVVGYVPRDEPLTAVAELSRILVADVASFDAPPGWEARADDPYGTPYVALQRRGPLDDALIETLAERGEVMAVHVADGGRVRWRQRGGGHDASGDGTGWEPITGAWEQHAPAALLPPAEIRWPPLR